VLAVLICLAVATTRVLLGLHYPSDVIAGLLLAVGVMAATAVLMQRIESRVASRSARP
jgi:undecaprenyl-diphosphatase